MVTAKELIQRSGEAVKRSVLPPDFDVNLEEANLREAANVGNWPWVVSMATKLVALEDFEQSLGRAAENSQKLANAFGVRDIPISTDLFAPDRTATIPLRSKDKAKERPPAPRASRRISRQEKEEDILPLSDEQIHKETEEPQKRLNLSQIEVVLDEPGPAASEETEGTIFQSKPAAEATGESRYIFPPKQGKNQILAELIRSQERKGRTTLIHRNIDSIVDRILREEKRGDVKERKRAKDLIKKHKGDFAEILRRKSNTLAVHNREKPLTLEDLLKDLEVEDDPLKEFYEEARQKFGSLSPELFIQQILCRDLSGKREAAKAKIREGSTVRSAESEDKITLGINCEMLVNGCLQNSQVRQRIQQLLGVAHLGELARRKKIIDDAFKLGDSLKEAMAIAIQRKNGEEQLRPEEEQRIKTNFMKACRKFFEADAAIKTSEDELGCRLFVELAKIAKEKQIKAEDFLGIFFGPERQIVCDSEGTVKAIN